MQTIVNKTFEEISLGDVASVDRALQASDLRAFAAAFGDADLLGASDAGQGASGIVTAIMTGLVATALPGPGSLVLATSLWIKGALPIGEPMTTQLVVREKLADLGVIKLDGQCADASGRIVAKAMLEVQVPTTRQQRQLPEHRLEGLFQRCRSLKPMLMGVVHPCSLEALAGAVDAAKAGLIKPVLFGPRTKYVGLPKLGVWTSPAFTSWPRTARRTLR